LEKGLHIGGVASALPFTLGIVMLGLSAAVFGTKVDANGPRWAMVIATVCFVAGFLVSALGIWLGWYWLVVVGYGGIGGIGLGIGYISPVSTLIKWFPDRPGLSTGIAIMGFGGGALGPITVNAIADSRSDIVGPARYTPAFVVLIVLLVLGFVANELVRPVNVRWHEPSTREEVTV
jgi:MFS family permease